MNLVFFRAADGGQPAGEFIAKQDERFQSRLEVAANELSQTGSISLAEAFRLKDGSWSLYLTDQFGEMHVFQLYISSLDISSTRSNEASQLPARRLVIAVPDEFDLRSGETTLMDASDYIKKTFHGDVCERLLVALDRAYCSLPHYDGSVEFTSRGVILRAVAKGKSIPSCDAEVALIWRD